VEPEFDERSLVVRSQGGDLDAFNILVERFQRPTYNLCLRMMASATAAEDATQEAFIAAYRAIKSFRGGSFRAWLFRIAANTCYDELRRLKSRPALSLDMAHGEGEAPFDLPSPEPGPEDEVQRLEFHRELQEALAELPSEQRLAIILCDAQGLDYAEIALTMNVSLGTVKSRISRARQRLRQILSRREPFVTRSRQTSGDM